MKKQIDIIIEECNKHGLNVYEVFREANVPEVTIGNWKKSEPKAFDTLDKIEKAIEKLKKRK